MLLEGKGIELEFDKMTEGTGARPSLTGILAQKQHAAMCLTICDNIAPTQQKQTLITTQPVIAFGSAGWEYTCFPLLGLQSQSGKIRQAVTDSSDKNRNENTPQGAALWRRLLALLYDAFLVGAIWMLLGFIVQIFIGTSNSQLVDGRVQTDPVTDWVIFSLMMGSCMLFYCWFWLRSGQTLGMLAWRIQLQGVDRKKVSVGQALLRFLLAWPSFFLFFAGYLWTIVDSRGDALHDKLSGTRVVLLPKEKGLL